jgi:hypothetical protein
MEPNAVGMKLEPLGQLRGARRTFQLSEQREEPRPRRLRQRVIGIGRAWKIDHAGSLHNRLVKRKCTW